MTTSAHFAASAGDSTLKPAASAFWRGGAGAQADDDVLDAAVAQVLGMGMALAADSR